jgi:type III secretion protein C
MNEIPTPSKVSTLEPHGSRSTYACTLFFLLVIFLFSSTVIADNVPNFDRPVSFNVREQNINVFLNALFQEVNAPISINSELEGTVNGKFNDTARNVFKEIANAFNLIIYYDGAVVQAYLKNEVERKLIPTTLSRARKIVGRAEKMNLPDENNTVVAQSDGVVVSGTRRFIAQIEELMASTKPEPRPAPAPKIVEVEKLVPISDESPMVYQVFKLKHAWATDTQFPVGGTSVTVPGVATLLKSLLEGTPPSSAGIIENENTLPGLKGKGLAATPGSTPGSEINTATEEATRIVADTRLNAIIIRDKQSQMDSYRRLIESLDVESGMVEIEATIIDINTDKSRELGINWRYQDDNVDVLLGRGDASDQSLVPGGSLLGTGQGGVLSFSLGEPARFLSRIRALEQKGAAKVISKPHVITLSDVEAVLAATTEFFVRVAGESEVDLFNVPVGTTLRVTPHIFQDNAQVNKIKLLVNIEDGTQANSSVDNIPVVERSNISTQAVVTEGDSLLVGGLVRETFRNTRNQVPVLGSMPLVGSLFRSETRQVNRIERLFMITPRLANGLGFNRSGSLPGLNGEESDIIRDADMRIPAAVDPARRQMDYWSNETRNNRTVSSEKAIATTAETTTRPTQLKPVFAVIRNNEFFSPFTVENLPAASQ